MDDVRIPKACHMAQLPLEPLGVMVDTWSLLVFRDLEGISFYM